MEGLSSSDRKFLKAAHISSPENSFDKEAAIAMIALHREHQVRLQDELAVVRKDLADEKNGRAMDKAQWAVAVAAYERKISKFMLVIFGVTMLASWALYQIGMK